MNWRGTMARFAVEARPGVYFLRSPDWGMTLSERGKGNWWTYDLKEGAKYDDVPYYISHPGCGFTKEKHRGEEDTDLGWWKHFYPNFKIVWLE
jgi:hypothetical protein